MNRGLEIVRRLLLTAMWAIIIFISIGSPAVGIKNYWEAKDMRQLKYEEYRNETAEWDNVPHNSNADIMLFGEELKRYNTVNSYWHEVLDQYVTYIQKKEREMWGCFGVGLVFPLIGFGLHKLINWIMVHKQKEPHR
jgi:hypothetical protein